MRIQGPFPNFIVWRISLIGIVNAEELFKGPKLKHIKKAYELLAASSIHFEFEEITPAYVHRFALLHEKLMQEKGSKFKVDFEMQVLNDTQYKWRALSLYDGEMYLGGALFNLKTRFLGLAFRVLPHNIGFSLPVPLSNLADILLMNEAIKLKKEYYSLGKDYNPYGINSAIGLAGYKLMMNARPYIPSQANIIDEIEWNEKFDILIFTGKKQQLAQHAKLCLVQSESIKRYDFLKKDFLTLELITSQSAN